MNRKAPVLIQATRQADKYAADSSRVIVRFFRIGSEERTRQTVERILTLDDETVTGELDKIYRNFAHRHRDLTSNLQKHFDWYLRHYVSNPDELSRERKLLLAAYFTMEYSVESAALFNPSIIPHFDQSLVPEGSLRVILSFRATGEGHISSIVFRTGTVDSSGHLRLDPLSRYLETPEIQTDALYEKKLFARKLEEIGVLNAAAWDILNSLPDAFTEDQLLERIEIVESEKRYPDTELQVAADTMEWLADSNYEMKFKEGSNLSERVIFPVSAVEKNGIEDARFVRFVDDDGSITYYATYTAYNGSQIMPQLIETTDFKTFKMITLNGPAARDKGMALFPRRVNGLYAMISRIDGVNLYLMYSEHLHFWYEGRIIQQPKYPWELVQIGNCGSPVETDRGWLLLTHGVGPMRQYCIGAVLLDKDDPSKMIGQLEEPILSPTEDEREGYVPNVVYTCGSIVHNDYLIIPYAMSDSRYSIASLPLRDILDQMTTG